MRTYKSLIRGAILASAVAFALPLSGAFAATTTLQLANVGTECTTVTTASGSTSFHFIINQVDGPVATSQQISLTFASGGVTYGPYTFADAQPHPTADDPNEVGWTVTYDQLAAAIYGSTYASLTAAQMSVINGLTLTGGSVTLPDGTTASRFNISDQPCANPGTLAPEVPFGAIYPALGGLTFIGGYALRRARRSGTIQAPTA